MFSRGMHRISYKYTGRTSLDVYCLRFLVPVWGFGSSVGRAGQASGSQSA